MAAELVEDARKFIGDIAAAHDHDPLRALLQMEKLVGGDAMFRALDVGNDGPCPGRNQDIFRAHLPPARQPDAMRPGDRRPLLDQFDFMVVQRVPVRSEEHTSELQSLMRISYAVFCLKKKKQKHRTYTT